MEESEKVQELHQRILRNRGHDIIINRVPPRIKREFVDWANDEFSGEDGKGDYGMALKWLWDERMLSTGLIERINELSAEVDAMKQHLGLDKPREEEQRARRMLDGSVKGVAQ